MNFLELVRFPNIGFLFSLFVVDIFRYYLIPSVFSRCVKVPFIRSCNRTQDAPEGNQTQVDRNCSLRTALVMEKYVL